jgi:hypothetical protein
MPVTTIAFHNLYDELNRDNRLFEERDAPIGDDLLLPFGELRRKAAVQGVTVATTSMLDPALVDAYVFIDMPGEENREFKQAIESGRPMYLLVLESPLACPQNHDHSRHRPFKAIFTYDDSVVDGSRYIKLNYAFNLPERVPHDLARKKKLCLTIAGNKRSTHPQELYSERCAAIRWFERNRPSDFDLFGFGWDEGTIGALLPLYPSWRGTVDRKRDVMGLYRFALCYENIRDVPGYITEKLFDPFFAGTVPVYRGADNVAAHIPAECFIDQRRFSDYAELYTHLAGMTDECYLGYLAAIEDFLTSRRAWTFSCDCFSETVLTEILRG